MDPYRGEQEALRARVEGLRQEVAAARRGASELLRAQGELERKLAALERWTGRRGQTRAAMLGAVVALGAAAAAAFAALVLLPGETPVVDATPAPPADAREWFALVRARCNALEARALVTEEAPPPGMEGQAYLAACFALAHRIEDARGVLEGLEPAQRPEAAAIVFDVAHPLAHTGDEAAAGVVMELVLEHLPDQPQALYHAGTGAYASDRIGDARRLLQRFVGTYRADDHYRARALALLGRLAPTAGPVPAYPPAPTDAPAPAPEGPRDTPSRDDLLRAMRAAEERVRACSDEHGNVTVMVAFEGRTGRPVDVVVRGEPYSRRETDCMSRAVRREARVPPFERTRFALNFPYRI